MAWTVKNSGVVLTPRLRNYLDQLANRLPFDIVVTSGVRTPDCIVIRLLRNRL